MSLSRPFTREEETAIFLVKETKLYLWQQTFKPPLELCLCAVAQEAMQVEDEIERSWIFRGLTLLEVQTVEYEDNMLAVQE